jgi:hypothetical protein
MSQRDDAGAGREQISLSAIYHQLDDHVGSDDPPYDVGAGLERLMTWMEEPSSTHPAPHPDRTPAAEWSEAAVTTQAELSRMRLDAMERTGRRRRMSALVALITVVVFSLLACASLLFGLPHVPVAAVTPLAATVGVVDAILAGVVAFIHRTTMGALGDDLQIAFGPRERSHASADRLGREAGRSAAPGVTKAPVVRQEKVRVGASVRWETVRYALDSSARTARLALLLVVTTVPAWVAIFIHF